MTESKIKFENPYTYYHAASIERLLMKSKEGQICPADASALIQLCSQLKDSLSRLLVGGNLESLDVSEALEEMRSSEKSKV